MVEKNNSESIYEAKTHWTWHPIAILVGLGLMPLAVVLLLNPETTLSTIALIVGVVLVLRAVITIFVGTRNLGAEKKTKATVGFIVGGVLLILGVILILRQPFILDALYLVAAIVFILDTLTNLFLMPRLWRHNAALAVFAGLGNAVVLAAAVFLMIDPAMDWYNQTLGLGVGIFAWGVVYLMYGIAAAGWLPRREPVREGEPEAHEN